LTSSSSSQSQKKKSEKRINDENGGLPVVNLHLYDAFGPKRATIFNFDALFFIVKGLGRFF
jgi:hypothetical protein